MAERYPLANSQQPVCLHDVRGRLPDPEPLGRAPKEPGIADRLRRRQQQQTPRVIRERLAPADIALLDPRRQRPRAQQPEPARQLRHRQASRQLEQRQRIPPRLRDDAVPHRLIQLDSHDRAEQRTGVAVDQAVHLQLRHIRQRLARLPLSEHDPDRFSHEATRDEGQRQRRRLIEPLRVIDHAQQRTHIGHFSEQAQHRQPNEKPIRGRSRSEPEHDLQRLTLRSREHREPIEHRSAEQVQAGVRQLHL
jgi:hypothetical protein